MKSARFQKNITILLGMVFVACDSDSNNLKRMEFAVNNPLSVSYIHQVLDMDQNKFFGHNACGPTSAVMIVHHHFLQPESPNAYLGHYVYSQYDYFTDKYGNNYCCNTAKDMNKYQQHIHEVPGAHGYIIIQKENEWLANPENIIKYFQNHGLFSKMMMADFQKTIQYNIDNGLPIIAGIAGSKTPGHYIVIIGYNNVGGVYVNDPYGNMLQPNWGNEYNGEQVVYQPYDYPFVIKRLITAWPIGIWGEYPGWMQTPKWQGFHGDDYNLSDDYSQKFQDAWQTHLSNFDAEAVAPWDNGYSPYVHCWPDSVYDYYGNCEGNSNALMLQDFRTSKGKWLQLVYNPEQKQVHPTFGKILAFWHDSWGYLQYGAPEKSEEVQWINGEKWHAQKFQYGWIGSCQEYTEVRQVMPDEFDGYAEQTGLGIAGTSGSSSSNGDNSSDGSPTPAGWCANDNECPLYHYCIDNHCQTMGTSSSSSSSNGSPTTETEPAVVEEQKDEGNESNNSNEVPQISSADLNNVELANSTNELSCQINCPKFNETAMEVVVWYGLEQSAFFASAEIFSIPYDQLCLWSEPSFEFNCVINGQYGWHEQTNVACSEPVVMQNINDHTRVIIQEHDCFSNETIVTENNGQEENEKTEPNLTEDDSTGVPEKNDDNSTGAQKLACSIVCPKNNDVQLNAAIWYGQNKQLIKNSGSQFAIEYCELCDWGEPSFEFNCFKKNFWGLHEYAETNCDAPIVKTYINQHTRVTVQNYECWPCWE